MAATALCGAWHAKLQQLFIQGKHTDLTIRVRVAPQQQQQHEEEVAAPSSKRRRTTKANATAASSSAADAAHPYTDIEAHSLVLRTRSACFDKALEGDWAETAERRIELVVDDERELEDLKLLIKLSYSDSYTHDDGGQLLPLATRLRLGVRADALEFVEAVDQIVEPLGLDFAGAITCLGNLPPAVEGHPGMAAVREQVAALLVKGIEKADKRQGMQIVALLQRAVDALANYLGPVAEMLEQRAGVFTPYLPLREDVKQLPLCVFKRLLASESLQLQSENEVYSLLMAWLAPLPRNGFRNQSAMMYNQLAPLLRYRHMTLDFLANKVSGCPLMQQSGLLSEVLLSAIAQRSMPPALYMEEDAANGPVNRGVPPSEARWEIKTSFTLEEVADAEAGFEAWMLCGPVAGYPFAVNVFREAGALGLRLATIVSRPTASQISTPTAGVMLVCNLELSGGVTHELTNCFTGCPVTVPDVFKKLWAEAVCEGSPHFPDGKLEVKATVRLATKEE